jgi:excisionase family DNA binding protein
MQREGGDDAMTDEAKSNGDELLTYEQLSERLKVKTSVLRGWVFKNSIPHMRFGQRTVRFRASEIEAWIKAHTIAPEG